MFFGKRLRLGGFHAGVPAAAVACIYCTLLGLFLMLALGGCGSSSGGGGNNNGGNNGSNTTRATVIGRVLDRNNNDLPVPNALITIGTTTVATGTDGRFTADVPANQTFTGVTVTGPVTSSGAAGYYNSFYVGALAFGPSTGGYTLTAITPDQSPYNIGDIIVYSQTGPPPPPIFPR